MSASLALSSRDSMHDLLFDDGLSEPAARGDDHDGWLMSYLDMLMLLITFFVLMLALYGGRLIGDSAPTAPPAALAATVHTARVPADFYRPPQQLIKAPIAADVGFYSGPRSTRARVERPASATTLALAVPLFDVPSSPAEPVTERRPLPQIDGVQVTAIPHGYNLRIQDHLLFDSSAVGFSAGGERMIQQLLPLLSSFRGTISVEGHTDSVPISTRQFPSNWELSGARAAAVVRALRLAGVDGDRLRAIGYASTHPLADNDTPDGRARNRRVELVLQEADAGR